jgi:hypothetical protein
VEPVLTARTNERTNKRKNKRTNEQMNEASVRFYEGDRHLRG